MKTTRLLIVVVVITLIAAGFSVLFTYTDLHYLTDGEKGVPRPEVESFWTLRVPLAFGLGALAIVVILSLLRAGRRKL